MRDRDREHLRDLALDLADTHGAVREAFGLLRGGMAERSRRGLTRRAVVAVGAATAVALTFLTWSAAAQSGRVEEDRFTCVGACAETEAEVDSRVRDGWSCTDLGETGTVSWRCVRD
ncbi:MAG TPA: hypothetical protein VNQ53_18525 [Nocardioides sp.]|nr:hypothetical protein [Nocardioides sp.]